MATTDDIFGAPSTQTVMWGDVKGSIGNQEDLTAILDSKLGKTEFNPANIKQLYESNIDTHQFTSFHKSEIDKISQIDEINYTLLDHKSDMVDMNTNLTDLSINHDVTFEVATCAHEKAVALEGLHEETTLTVNGIISEQNKSKNAIETNKVKISALEHEFAHLTGYGGGNLDSIRNDIITLKADVSSHQRLLTSINTIANSAEQRSKESETALISAEIRLEALEGKGDSGTLFDRLDSIECDSHSVKHVLLNVDTKTEAIENRTDKTECAISHIKISLDDIRGLMQQYETRIAELETAINKNNK